MNRRGFIGSIIALGAAPAIVRAESLMRIAPQFALMNGVWVPSHLTRTVAGIEFVGPMLFDFANQFGLMAKIPGVGQHAVRAATGFTWKTDIRGTDLALGEPFSFDVHERLIAESKKALTQWAVDKMRLTLPT